jgi:hypothetical protein
MGREDGATTNEHEGARIAEALGGRQKGCHSERSEEFSWINETFSGNDGPDGFFARLSHSCAFVSIRGSSGGLRFYPCRAVPSVVQDGHGMSLAVRGVLHRAVDHLAHPRHAARQTGRDSVRAAAGGYAVRNFRAARAPGVLREPAADGGNVRRQPRRGAGSPDRVGVGDETGCLSQRTG